MSRLEAHAGFFRLLIKGIFDPVDKKLISKIVKRVRTRDYTVLVMHNFGRLLLYVYVAQICRSVKTRSQMEIDIVRYSSSMPTRHRISREKVTLLKNE